MQNLLKTYQKFFKSTQKTDFEKLREKLRVRQRELSQEFSEKHRETVKWLSSKGIDVDEIWAKGTRGALASVAAGMVLLSSGITPDNKITTQPELPATDVIASVTPKTATERLLADSLAKQLPTSNRPLTREEEQKVLATISQVTGVKVAADLEGNRLNTNYGRIGLEQHLPLFPGDSLDTHFTSAVGRATYGKSGMTAGRGAFGYFAPSKGAVTPTAIEQEKYYAVVQTFLIPGWNSSKAEWYKHRKVLIINPVNGEAVVGDIGDSGPATFTGRNFGGSPELMNSIGIYYGNSKISVLVFFIDESSGAVPLGPI